MSLKIISYFIFVSILFGNIKCQSSEGIYISEQYQYNCTSTQIFDISHLQCVECPIYSVPSSGGYNCVCNSTAKYFRNNGGNKIQCTPCDVGFVQSTDGWSCVKEDACDKDKGYLAENDTDGEPFLDATNSYPIRKCITCDTKTVPTSSGCISCYPWAFTSTTINITDLTCSVDCKTTSGGICFKGISTTSAPNDNAIPLTGTLSFNSWYLTQYATSAYLLCNSTDNRNTSACQLLANMCTLIYNTESSSSTRNDVCKAFSSIIDTSTKTWPDNMPLLEYNQYLGQYKTDAERLVQLYLSYDKTQCVSKTLSFVAAKYKLNGELLSYGSFDFSEIDLCSQFYSGLARPSNTSFITINYQQTCKISVEQLLKLGSKEPVFYNLYLKYQVNGVYRLLAVPLVVYNYRERDIEVNRGAGDNSRLHRRFFLIDQYTSKTSVAGNAQYIRYAKSISLQINLFTDNKEGRIHPPVLYVEYDYISAVADTKATIAPTFEVKYQMNLDTQVRDVWISVGVLSFFALLWSSIRTWIWNKRSGKQTLDIVTIFKFLMYICGSVANVFFVVCIGVAIWWLIFFKGQDLAFVLLPQGTQGDSFQALLIIAFVLKIVDVLHLILVQVSFDVFLLDWEKPKVEAGNKGSVSCWRTLFVANEWNEIQTFRKTNTTLQLVFVLLFLKVINLEAICTIDCNTSVIRNENSYIAPYSPILRIGMAASIYILIGITQWVIYKFIYSRCVEDKLNQFVDFCSVANISVFILSHAHYGYYIHGKSPNGNSDTSMKQMVLGFEKEEHDLVAKRGLLPDRSNQIFSISITNKLRNQYAKVMQPLYERRAVRPNEDKSRSNKQITAYEQLNRFLVSFIEHSLREIDYVVTKRNFLENLLDLEFREPGDKGYFYEDDGPSFQNVVFAGKERTLFIFDLLIFLFVDYFAQNYVLAAFFVYIASKIVNIMRSDLGKMNLSRKTLVDRRFLI